MRPVEGPARGRMCSRRMTSSSSSSSSSFTFFLGLPLPPFLALPDFLEEREVEDEIERKKESVSHLLAKHDTARKAATKTRQKKQICSLRLRGGGRRSGQRLRLEGCGERGSGRRLTDMLRLGGLAEELLDLGARTELTGVHLNDLKP